MTNSPVDPLNDPEEAAEIVHTHGTLVGGWAKPDNRSLVDALLDEFEHWGVKESEVMWLGHKDGTRALLWPDFKAQYAGHTVRDTYLDNDLVVVGRRWWLEYDSEEGDGPFYFSMRLSMRRRPTVVDHPIRDLTGLINPRWEAE